MIRWKVLLCVLLLATLAQAATPIVYKVGPIKMTNGWQVTGTITTDGTVGLLGAANILDWNLTIVQTTDMVWTKANSNALNISGVSTDGNKIYVNTSPDGVNDGGTLYVSRPSSPYNIPTNAVLGDFTQLSYNLGYGMGGIAGWQDEIWGLNYVGLNQLYGTKYVAASLMAGQTKKFQIIVPTLATNPLLMTMFGTITTDGTIGVLKPRNLVAWNITARSQDIRTMDKTNSQILYATGLKAVSQGTTLVVLRATPGQLVFGVPGMRPTFVTLADFTDPYYPDGFANYYVGNYGVMGEKTPLVGPLSPWANVGKKQ